MHPEGSIIIDFFGEGKTDIGMLAKETKTESPCRGVVPIIVHTLCGKPSKMLVKLHGVPFLQGKGLWQKVRFAKRNVCNKFSNAAVFVVDSEGDIKAKKEALCKGRDESHTSLPMAVGVAHPCIESWLLADPDAIRSGLNLDTIPEVPSNPEDLPAPQKDLSHNPKTVLRTISGILTQELSAHEKDQIAADMNMEIVRKRCPQGFAPFADEVESYIRPLFSRA